MKFDAPRIDSYSSGETTTFTIGETAMKPRFLTRMLSVMFVLTCFAWTSSATAGSGGTITWGKPTEVISFDPHYSGDGASWTFFYLIYDQLLSTDDDLGLVPGLAESWDVSDDELVYTFHLREGATFSNGRSVSADDVVGVIKRHIDPETGGSWGRQLGEIKSVEAVDERTVRIELAKPSTPFLNVLSMTTMSILPMKELNDGTFDPSKEFLGSGPFMVKEHLQDESWTLVPNPHYQRKGYPIVDELVIRILPDASARIAALRDGRVDIAFFVNPDTERLLANVPNVKVEVQNTSNYFRLDVSAIMEDSPFTDLRVRQAMHYALDRERIADIVFGGNAKADYPVPGALGLDACRDDPFYTMPREQRLEKARALLAEANAEGIEVGIIGSSTLMIYPLIAQVVQSSLNEAGFKAFVEKIPAAEWYERVFVAEPDFDLAVSWFAGYTDPAMVLFWWTPAGSAGWADGYTIADDRITQAVADVRSLPNGPGRLEALNRVCGLINENSNVLSLVSKPDYFAYRTDLVNVRISPNEGNFDTLKYAEEFSRKD